MCFCFLCDPHVSVTCIGRLWIIYFLVLRSFHLFSPFRFFFFFLLTKSHRCFSYVYYLIMSYSMVSVCVSLTLLTLSLSLSSLFFLVLAIDSGLMSPLLNRLPSFTVHRENFIFLVACRHEVIHVRTVRAINNHYTRVYYR